MELNFSLEIMCLHSSYMMIFYHTTNFLINCNLLHYTETDVNKNFSNHYNPPHYTCM